MSAPDRSIDPRLLKAAKEVFLEKGFEMAQLSEICKKAGVTTGALYKRYSGKEELFSEIVSDTIEAMDNYVQRIAEADLTEMTDQELLDGFHMNPEVNLRWFKYLYDHKEGFTLLIKCASGTRYSDFHDVWTEKLNSTHYKFYQEARRRGLATKEVSENEMNILTSAVWTLFYKPFMLDCSWKEIEAMAYILRDFSNWYDALGIKK
ncbi:MAG: TetR/AcrR family transcriptional regulator [Eubacterium sp.]|nr:TetR/AcrR family transcriptional regulator [Eubacterium sp.]